MKNTHFSNYLTDLAVEKRVAVTTSLKAWVQNELKDKPNGLWGRVLQSQYKKDFQQEPPSDLLKIICGFPFIKKEEWVIYLKVCLFCCKLCFSIYLQAL